MWPAGYIKRTSPRSCRLPLEEIGKRWWSFDLYKLVKTTYIFDVHKSEIHYRPIQLQIFVGRTSEHLSNHYNFKLMKNFAWPWISLMRQPTLLQLSYQPSVERKESSWTYKSKFIICSKDETDQIQEEYLIKMMSSISRMALCLVLTSRILLLKVRPVSYRTWKAMMSPIGSFDFRNISSFYLDYSVEVWTCFWLTKFQQLAKANGFVLRDEK